MQSDKKKLCPYSLKEITLETGITFECGHSCHKSIFEVLDINTFKCSVSGCKNSNKIVTQKEYIEEEYPEVIEIEEEPKLTLKEIDDLTESFKEELVKFTSVGDIRGIKTLNSFIERYFLKGDSKKREPRICSKCGKPVKGNHKKMIINTQLKMVCK